jgi:uncharacterized protein
MSAGHTLPRFPIGWPLLSVPDADGRLHFPHLARSVRENMRVILSTRAGEQLMHPGYGAGLVDFIGQPDTVTTRRRIYDRVTESVGRWESRIDLDRVDVLSMPDAPGHLRIEIAYRLRRTGEPLTFGVNLALVP